MCLLSLSSSNLQDTEIVKMGSVGEDDFQPSSINGNNYNSPKTVKALFTENVSNHVVLCIIRDVSHLLNNCDYYWFCSFLTDVVQSLFLKNCVLVCILNRIICCLNYSKFVCLPVNWDLCFREDNLEPTLWIGFCNGGSSEKFHLRILKFLTFLFSF